MSDVQRTIMRDLEDDVTISSKEIVVEVQGGFLKKRKTLRLHGTARSEAEKRKILEIASHHAGDGYELKDDIEVKA
jgi:osmotically-inducible protein OsmY